VIVDLQRFIDKEQPYWSELEEIMDLLERRIERKLGVDEAKRFYYLYQRASSDLAKLNDFPLEPLIRQHLESIVARAYSEIHEVREKPYRFSPVSWLLQTFPQTFRRHIQLFNLVLIITLIGSAFGAIAIQFDPDAKRVLLPFAHLQDNPSERVAYEESRAEGSRVLSGGMATFSSYLFTHNTRVSILTLALGMSWGIGTIMLIFYNGVVLGAVVCDYLVAGEATFLVGWLLPHGAVEIPAILIAGQAGLLLGRALIGWGTPLSVKLRLRSVLNDIVTLIFGVAILLVWAGIVESFLSQYHEPVLPYWLKIAFGLAELGLLSLFLARSGREQGPGEEKAVSTIMRSGYA
jgi:uncharacterized membrane protein SpoIIM required for sporulation